MTRCQSWKVLFSKIKDCSCGTSIIQTPVMIAHAQQTAISPVAVYDGLFKRCVWTHATHTHTHPNVCAKRTMWLYFALVTFLQLLAVGQQSEQHLRVIWCLFWRVELSMSIHCSWLTLTLNQTCFACVYPNTHTHTHTGRVVKFELAGARDWNTNARESRRARLYASPCWSQGWITLRRFLGDREMD